MATLLEIGSREARRLLVLAPLGVLLTYAGAPRWTSGFREDEVQCEEAKAHVLHCCDPFRGQLSCKFISNGCGSTFPDLDVNESRAVQTQSCNELRANGSCDRDFGEER